MGKRTTAEATRATLISNVILTTAIVVAPGKSKFFVNLLHSRPQERFRLRRNLVAKLKGLFGGCKDEVYAYFLWWGKWIEQITYVSKYDVNLVRNLMIVLV